MLTTAIKSLTISLLILIVAQVSTLTAQPHGAIPISVNTSSPRATLQTVLASLEAVMQAQTKGMKTYMQSDRLYLSEEEERFFEFADRQFAKGAETLDISQLPSGFRKVLVIESLVRMADILSKIELPPMSSVPDHEAMVASGSVSWRIPGSRIEITIMTEGIRAGEYLFSANTIASLGRIHDRTYDLPVRMESVQKFLETFPPNDRKPTLYDAYRDSTASFGVLPERWAYLMPSWLTQHMLGASVWQWAAILLYLSVVVASILLVSFVYRRIEISGRWRIFAVSMFVVGFAILANPFLEALSLSGWILYGAGTFTVSLLYLSIAWAGFAGANALAELTIKRQNLRVGGIDSQLVHLGSRLFALLLTVLLLIEGADKIGLPAYSLLTGLGVGGFAFALAARDTLANLLGSIAIMLEKPFRTRDWVKVGDMEGTVERVGFRTTRIRTFEDSIVSIPNNLVVNTPVDNLGVRGRRRQQFNWYLSHQTSRSQLQSFLSKAREIISAHPMTQAEEAHVHLSDVTEEGLGIFIDFNFVAPNYGAELTARETIIFQLMELAETLKVNFAAPTQAQNTPIDALTM